MNERKINLRKRLRAAGASFASTLRRAPVLRHIYWSRFRRLEPPSENANVGTPVVRRYWDDFLQKHRDDIRGIALEIGSTNTLRKYGGDALLQAEAIDLTKHRPEITIAMDLSRADDLDDDRFDCFVNQFTMHVIYDVDAALYHSVRLLKTGGTLLVNFSAVDYCFPNGLDMGTGRPMFVFWSFTPIQVENLLRRCGLTPEHFEIEVMGNLFSRVAYQYNVPTEDLTDRELNYRDPGYPVLICARIVKPAGWNPPKPTYRDPWLPSTSAPRHDPKKGHLVR